MRLNSFDYFRAIAILIIVTGHSYSPWVIDTFPEKIVGNLITGGTSLFVFISGFFFHYVFYPKFNYIKFIKKKTRNVFLPYLVLSSLAFLFIIVIRDKPYPQLIREITGITDYLILYFQYFWTGCALTAYWYIPFIMIVFLMSPIFIRFIKLSRWKQISIFIVFLIVSMIIKRPTNNFGTFPYGTLHSVVYFMPIYLLGMIYSLNQKSISNYIKNKSFIFALLTVLLAIIQALLDRNDTFTFIGINIFYSSIYIVMLQKISMIFFFMALLQKIDRKEIPILKYIASISFAIYFIHPWVLYCDGPFRKIEFISQLPGIIIVPVKTAIVLVICLVIIKFCKKILHNNSRYIIGW